MNDYNEIVKQEWERFKSNSHYPNIMLLGGSGCGKSTLINTIFGRNVAYVNDTSRGTTDFDVFLGVNNNSTVNLIDSMGYELGDDVSKYIVAFSNWIKEHYNTEQKVHLIWYCVSCNKWQDFDTDVLKAICEMRTMRNKVAVIITKCDNDDENGSMAATMRQVIQEDVSVDIPIFEVTNLPSLPLQIEKLIEWSVAHLDGDEIKKMFIASQMIDLKAKKKAVAAIISGAVGIAAATGAIPIPGPDAPILTAEQVAMSAAIINAYGLNMAKGIVTTLVSDVFVSNLGKTIVGSLLKLFPGFGTLLGSVINGGVAAVITTALGIAISETCYASCKKIANGEVVNLEVIFDSKIMKVAVEGLINKNKGKSSKELMDIIDAYGEEVD